VREGVGLPPIWGELKQQIYIGSDQFVESIVKIIAKSQIKRNKMRISESYKKTIKKLFSNVFGEGEIYLFGSRVDDSKRGGDIDLYIIPKGNELTPEELFDKKIQFLSKLQLSLGEQKIDIIISKDKNRSIEKEAIFTGVEL